MDPATLIIGIALVVAIWISGYFAGMKHVSKPKRARRVRK